MSRCWTARSFCVRTTWKGCPLQVLALPWISRSGLMAALDLEPGNHHRCIEKLGERLTELINGWLETADPDLPVVLTAHCSVQGATLGGERR